MLLIASLLGCIYVCVCMRARAFGQVFSFALLSVQYLWLLISFSVYKTFRCFHSTVIYQMYTLPPPLL